MRKVQGLIQISTRYSAELGKVPVDTPQISSVALHELGHFLNLDHTCDALNSEKVADPKYRPWRCADILSEDVLLPPETVEAIKRSVLYPGLRVTSLYVSATGKKRRVIDLEIKEKLTALDTNRAYCLYEGLDLSRATSAAAAKSHRSA